ncbi:wax ester/triacylglycerol synthase domain-containing protein [Pseudosporangium ferrugineum]|uniref:Wax ester synthase-like acyl-CoA acyltransferase family protein n=1 Tax=Pseudosporangium ferrugineum TaxID=439699 RepID=A0A2T0SG65_9ACTN|nr:wax ester/triacylglycerol synthase domain-containing protein [Pseudosporangium ferrugineum]PRY32401.1 wax ester synthase-like acyl-CoA acyltransferase family protein [Pseudosporangium ferrugineum]
MEPSGTAARVDDAGLAFLAMDTGDVPVQFAVILVLDRAVGLPAATGLLAARVAAVPRLRQRIADPGVWATVDPFDVRDHVRGVRCPPPGDGQALLDAATALLLEPLDRGRPLWRAAVVDGLATGATALVVVLHHAVADGLGGLTILAGLTDDGPAERSQAAPEPRRRMRRLVRGVLAAGGLTPHRAPACSLLRPTGPYRRAVAVTRSAAALHESAHRCGATVNSVLLVAVAAALHRVLAGRGEAVPAILTAIPVAGARTGAGPSGADSPLLVAVPVDGTPAGRARRVTATGHRRRSGADSRPDRRR